MKLQTVIVFTFLVLHRSESTINRINRWPSGKIPYVIADSYNSAYRGILMQAINDIQHYTCVRFIPRTNEKAYVLFTSSPTNCYSTIGYTGKMNVVQMMENCAQSKNIVLHEIMHSMGFLHEHNRKDRNNYIHVLYENINRNATGSFTRYTNYNGFGLPYDYKSVMHYQLHTGSRNGKPTIIPKHTKDPNVGNYPNLSKGDIMKINKVYNCKGYKNRRNQKSLPSPNYGYSVDNIFVMNPQRSHNYQFPPNSHVLFSNDVPWNMVVKYSTSTFQAVYKQIPPHFEYVMDNRYPLAFQNQMVTPILLCSHNRGNCADGVYVL